MFPKFRSPQIPARISLMAVNAKQELVGGVILPGPQLSMNALVQKTAQLPQIDPAARAPESVLGKSTSACLQNGFVLGTASLLDGLADRFCAELGAQTAFYATGDLPRSIRLFPDPPDNNTIYIGFSLSLF